MFFSLNELGPVKSGRKVTINDQLRKRRAKGRHIDIKFPKEFAKVCGEHASLFKSEITVLVRTIPLQVKKWKEMDEFHPGTTTSVWKKLKVTILEFEMNIFGTHSLSLHSVVAYYINSLLYRKSSLSFQKKIKIVP